MKILLISVGTRGDMEPFLAIGAILRDKDHQVVCAFPEQFRYLAEETGLKFSSLGSKFIELLDSPDGKAALGGSGSGFGKLIATVRLSFKQNEVNRELVDKQIKLIESEQPDRILYNGKAVYPIIWSADNPGQAIMISPVPYMHYVKGHTHVAFNSNLGVFLNKTTFALANYGMITTLRITLKWLGMKRKFSKRQIKDILHCQRVIYTISPTLFPRPDYWTDNLQVLGHHQRNPVFEWQPSQELKDFIERKSKLIFLTFGSMTSPAPEEKTRVIVDILERNGIPAIINSAAGGLIEPEGFQSEHILFIKQIPYEWILPKIHAIIHHGGSGTTHLALKHGCASLIIPHIIDQFVWNQIITDLGAGPKGIKIGKVNIHNLEPLILDLVDNTSYKRKAEAISTQMAKENYRQELYSTLIGT